ncbi:unnamed protein product, partial [Prorocentrum cordatum]
QAWLKAQEPARAAHAIMSKGFIALGNVFWLPDVMSSSLMAATARYPITLMLVGLSICVGAVDVRSCDWVDGHLQVKWQAPAGTPSDYYEIQLSSTSEGQAFGIFSTAALSADIDSLSPSTTYWVRVRAHA